MLFHTKDFLWFMALLLPLILLLPRFAVMGVLLGVSYVFYGFSSIAFIFLLLATSTIDYNIARYFESRPQERAIGITLSAVVNFSILGVFKYSNFFFSNINSAFTSFGLQDQLPLIEVMLPVGISFYTFQSFAYIVDVLMGRIQACKSYPRYLLYVAWFPQLVAGPIMRAKELMPQIENIENNISGMANRIPAAVTLFAEGWLRKCCADLLSQSSDVFFNNPTAATSGEAVIGIIAFGLQIYGDFSGYTKMAQGISWLFGVKLMENFNLPYAAIGIRDFWRRWHISLSTWFRDYLYIPLGGDRLGSSRTFFNIFLTMLLCGFWHGANWTFILWGMIHGGLLIAERMSGKFLQRIPKMVATILTLVLVFLAWVPFRAPDLSSMVECYAALANGGWERPALGFMLGLIGLIAMDTYYKLVGRDDYNALEDHEIEIYNDWKPSVMVSCCALAWFFAYTLNQNETSAFIYFQF